MAKNVLMPKQGNSVESCIILEWKLSEGEAVAEGDVICEVETDKATIEVESTASGILLKKLYEADDDVPVQVPIAIVGEAGEDITGLLSETGPAAEEAAPEETAAPAEAAVQEETETASVVEKVSAGTSAASPRARMAAAKKGIDPTTLAGSGAKGRVIERDVEAASAGTQPLTPAAVEKMAAEGLSAPVSGSGIGGRVLSSDLLSLSSQLSAEQVADAAVSAGFPGPVSDVKVRGVRKVTARRMFESISTTAQLTLNSSADARALLALRKRFKESDPAKGLSRITINDIVLYAVAKTLKEYPEVNAHFLGDTIRRFEHIHLGCAVDTPKGLMVPVLRYADLMSLKTLSDTAKTLFTACLEGKADPESLAGGTFTVTNLGGMGIESFTPVLNTPESGILGVSNIQLKPIQGADGVEFVPHIGLSITFDHQAFDGADAARFMKTLADHIKNIDLLMAI